MNKRAPLNQGHFRNWLAKHKPGQIVGIAGKECECPLAQHLKEKLDTTAVMVGDPEGLDEVYTVKRKRYVTPKWALDFMLHVDSSGTGHNITARRALKLLEVVVAKQPG